jgi:phage shock protein A
VFEDKIARLEENVGYYKDSLSRVEKNCDKLYHENKELKQRIAELESKETQKPTKCTTVIIAKEINGQTYVQLEDFMSVVNDLQAEIGT